MYGRLVEVTIRPYEPRDATGVADVFYRSVREVALSDYTADQVKAWAPGPGDVDQERRRCGDGRLVLIAADQQGRVVAFVDLEPDGHIDRLFCAPEAVGLGIASRLYEAVEAAARERGIRRLFTEASITARPFFEAQGFAVLAPQVVTCRGSEFVNYRMERVLAEPAAADGGRDPGSS